MFRNVSLTVLINIGNQALLFIIFLLSAKMFGPEGRGVVSSLVATVTLVGSFFGFSIGRIVMNEVLSNNTSPELYLKSKYANYLAILFISTFTGIVFTVFLILFFPGFFGQISFTYVAIIFLGLPYYVWSSYSIYFYSILGKTLVQNKITIAVKFIFLALLGIMFFMHILTLKVFVGLFSFVNLLQFTIDQRYLKGRIGYDSKVTRSVILLLLKRSSMIHIDTVGYILYSSLVVVVLNIYLPVKEVGYFNFAAQLISIILVVPTIVSQFLNAEIAKMGCDGVWPLQKKVILLTCGVVIVIGGMSYLLLPFLISVFNLKFQESIPIFNLLIISLLPNTFCSLMSPQWLGRGLFKYVSYLTLFSGAVGFAILFCTIKRLGVSSGIVANIVIFSVMALVNLYFFFWINKKTALVVAGNETV